jgi:hypothetical protein
LAKTQVMRQQLLDSEPVQRGGRVVERRRGRLVQAAQRRRQIRQLLGLPQSGRQQLRQKLFAATERRADQAPQRGLRKPGGAGIDRRQRRLRQRLVRATRQQAVFRMNHLGPKRPAAHLAVAFQPQTGPQLLRLRRAEVEEAQRERAAGIGDAHQQRAPAPLTHFGGLDAPTDQRCLTLAQAADGLHTAAVLEAQRQVQQQILRPADAKQSETADECRADARQRGEGGRGRHRGPWGGPGGSSSRHARGAGCQPSTSTASASTADPRGSAATPSVARAG